MVARVIAERTIAGRASVAAILSEANSLIIRRTECGKRREPIP